MASHIFSLCHIVLFTHTSCDCYSGWVTLIGDIYTSDRMRPDNNYDNTDWVLSSRGQAGDFDGEGGGAVGGSVEEEATFGGQIKGLEKVASGYIVAVGSQLKKQGSVPAKSHMISPNWLYLHLKRGNSTCQWNENECQLPSVSQSHTEEPPPAYQKPWLSISTHLLWQMKPCFSWQKRGSSFLSAGKRVSMLAQVGPKVFRYQRS